MTLKIGKEKLRAATSRWTPEPRATNDYRAPTGPNARLPQLPPRAAARKPPQSYESDPSPSEDDEDAEGEEDDMMLDQDDDEDVQMADVTNIDNDMGVDIDAEGEDDLDDAEGEDEELVDEDAEGETDDDMMDSDGDTGMDISRTGTPGDMSRLTNRQRTRMGDITTADHLLELPSGYGMRHGFCPALLFTAWRHLVLNANIVIGKSNTNKDLALTAQEQELKRTEMARRRKHLTDQRLHEEKMDTINRLLKKQTPKMRGSRGTVGEAATPAGGGGNESETLAEKPPPPNMLRWVSRKDGNFVAVPESWLDAPVGQVFMKQERTPRMRKLVEEID